MKVQNRRRWKRPRAAAQSRRARGFTLVELMVVLIIVGILGGLAVSGIGAYRDEAKKVAAKSFGRQVLNAFAVYAVRDDVNGYPIVDTCDELDDVVSKNGFEINAEHKLNYCNDGVGFEVGPMCRCKDPVNNVEIRYNCYGTVPPLCSIAARDPWIELEYFFPLHEVAGDQLLMVSTPGTVEVISMNDLPPEGVIN